MKRLFALHAPPRREERTGAYCGSTDAPPMSEIREALSDREYEAAYVVDRDILFYGGPDCVAASGGLRKQIDWDVHNHPNEPPLPSIGDACHAMAYRLKRMDIVGYARGQRIVASYREPPGGWPCYEGVGLHEMAPIRPARAYGFDWYMKLLARWRRWQTTRPMREQPKEVSRFAQLEIDGPTPRRRR